MRSACDTWPSPWGFEEGDGPPEKTELFPPDVPRASTWGMEDFLQHNGVFVNGMTDRTAHSDSYMTVVKADRLERSLAILQEAFAPTPEDWKVLTDHWLGSPNMQPPLRLVALTICRKHGITPAEIDHSKWR